MPNLNALFTNREWIDLSLNGGRALMILLVAWLIALVARRSIRQAGTRRKINVNTIALLHTLSRVGITVLAILLILPLFGVDWATLAAVAGAVGLAVSLAFQDLLRNFIAGVYILGERSFTLGDKITVQTSPAITGVVQSIELRITIMRTDDGVLVVVPNNTLFSTPVTNHTAVNLQRDVVQLQLPGGDLALARTQINTVLLASEGVANSPGPSITVEEATPSSLCLRVEFWTPPAQEAIAVPLVVEALRLAFPAAEVIVIS